MDKLKSFIENNKDEFDNIPLPEGHLDRFREKLQGKREGKWKYYTLYSLMAAASIGLLLLIVIPEEWVENKLREAYEVCESREEIEELKLYYEMQIFEIVSQMEDIKEDSDSPAVAGLMEASKQVISATKRFEKNIFPNLPCSDDGIFALNQHYSNSLESLHIMLNQMQQYTEND